MNSSEFSEAHPDLDRRTVEPVALSNSQTNAGEFFLRFFIVAVGVVLGVIFAFFVALFTGLIQFTC